MNQRAKTGAELRRLHEVAAEYRNNGYKVVISPAGSDLPPFLRDVEVDLLARGKKENVVVQVRSRKSLSHSTGLTQLAERLEGKDGWRFELIVAATPQEAGEEIRAAGTKPLRVEDIQDRLAEASALQQNGHDEAAFLLAWTAAEAALRATLAPAGIAAVERPTPAGLVKTLYSYGVIDDADYDLLQRCADLRATIAHGFKPAKPDRKALTDLVDFVDRLMKVELRVEA